jgi:hypothetical protein
MVYRLLVALYTYLHLILVLQTSDCPQKIRDFVQEGHKRKILPLPVSI